MSKTLRFLIATLLLFVLASLAVAQEDDIVDDAFFQDVETVVHADPELVNINNMTQDATIEAITDDSESYYGAVVTFEGTLSNFVGTRIFEVMEDELLTDSIVLVVNNSSQAFPGGLVEGALVRVTGRVHPSYDEFLDDDTYAYTPFDEGAPESDVERTNMIDFVHRGYVPEEFGEHTLIEVLNVESIEVLGYDDLLTVD